jgi:hypothetical protein
MPPCHTSRHTLSEYDFDFDAKSATTALSSPDAGLTEASSAGGRSGANSIHAFQAVIIQVANVKTLLFRDILSRPIEFRGITRVRQDAAVVEPATQRMYSSVNQPL